MALVHPIIARMKWRELRKKASNIKAAPQAMKDKLESVLDEIGPCGVLEEVRIGMCHTD